MEPNLLVLTFRKILILCLRHVTAVLIKNGLFSITNKFFSIKDIKQNYSDHSKTTCETILNRSVLCNELETTTNRNILK